MCGIRSLVIIFNTIEKVNRNIKDFNPRFYEWKLSFTVLRTESGLNSMFDWFQLVHIIFLMSILTSEVTFIGSALRWLQNDSKNMSKINFISMNDSINSERKRIIREFFGESRYMSLKIKQNARRRYRCYCAT